VHVVRYTHPEETSSAVELAIGSSDVRLTCRWPLDRDTDEWFNFRLTVKRDDWDRALNSLTGTGRGSLGAPEAEIILTRPKNDRVTIEMSHGQGALRKSLYLSDVFALSDLQSQL
jgi:hypothetical protein